MTAGPANGTMASGPRRRPRNTSRPARIVRSLSDARPIAGAYMANSPLYRRGSLNLALSCICVFCHPDQQVSERFRLSVKQPVGDEAVDGPHGIEPSSWRSWANHRTERQVRTYEFARDRE